MTATNPLRTRRAAHAVMNQLDASPASHQPSDPEMVMLVAPGIGPTIHQRLLEAFGSAAAVVGASSSAIARVEGIGRARAVEIRRSLDGADPRREREAMARVGASIVLKDDARYPALLATIPDPPPALWVAGDTDSLGTSLGASLVAIVGARRCTMYGREQASRLSFALAECGFSIVSGGARGIDAAAHLGAMRAGGRTVAVLGCGLGHCYPPEHGELFRSIERQGALISELPTDYPPRADGFPRRNRLISGLALGVVVVEAAERSGALITAREAAESHHREVMAMPGPVDSLVSAGCHRAIREGWAGLVTGVGDVLAQLAGAGILVRGAQEAAGRSSEALNETGQLVRNELTARAAQSRVAEHDAESIGLAIDRPVGEVFAALTLLQLEGRVVRGERGFRLRVDLKHRKEQVEEPGLDPRDAAGARTAKA